MSEQHGGPPKTYRRFTERYPDLAEAWSRIHEEGRRGPLDERVQRLVKLGVAIGAQREGAVHASVRKARRLGIEAEALEQVVALAAGTLGMPSTVAAYTWVRDVLDGEDDG
ncbi:MAG: carboxymuconolactone decarboxylase family protein [Gemmatimonadetes bacterium]|nr:MAG: carboxymuconolactone decarboxylase family protein [Gemmatimonadota bacterium]